MVAADIHGIGMEGNGEIGVWATNSLDGSGLIFAVDGLAKEFSDWGHGDTTDANIMQSSDGVAEAKECASKAHPRARYPGRFSQQAGSGRSARAERCLELGLGGGGEMTQ
jgi:hypothetical protein